MSVEATLYEDLEVRHETGGIIQSFNRKKKELVLENDNGKIRITFDQLYDLTKIYYSWIDKVGNGTKNEQYVDLSFKEE